MQFDLFVFTDSSFRASGHPKDAFWICASQPGLEHYWEHTLASVVIMVLHRACQFDFRITQRLLRHPLQAASLGRGRASLCVSAAARGCQGHSPDAEFRARDQYVEVEVLVVKL